MSRTILVAGATGQQGRGFIAESSPAESSLSSDYAQFKILALTRDIRSGKAKALSALPHVTVVQGDLNDPPGIKRVFDAAGGKGAIWGVFCVLMFPGLNKSAAAEEKQGLGLVDIAREYEVSHFIYSSVERGGEHDDDQTILDRNDRAVKVNIERHVRSLPKDCTMRWTILRPAFFMENFAGTIGRVTIAILKNGLRSDTKIQLVAGGDSGHVAHAAFQDPERYAGRIITVASENLTVDEIMAAYERGAGKSMPSVPSFIARVLLSTNQGARDVCTGIERVHERRLGDPDGYDANLRDAKAAFPSMTTVEAWAGRRQNPAQDRNWNQVTVGAIVTGKQ